MAASKYGALESEVRKLLEDGLGGFLTGLIDGSGDHQPSLVLEKQLSKALQSYYDLKNKLEKASLDVAVLALAKSGKSTFLNALTGASILPSNNVPETARIVALEHCQLENGDGPVLKYKQGSELLEIKGEAEIRTHLEILNKNVRSRRHSKNDEQILTVQTQLAALQAQPTDLAVGLRLLDTPGPNEAGEDALRHSVERLLDSVDAVVYILDYTKLKTQEETDLLTKLSKSNPQLIMRLASRLFFVVNKVDVMHVSEGLQEDELREYVADLVTTQMNFASFQLRPDQVLLVSAQDALLSRLITSGKATESERTRFGKKAFGRASRTKSEADYQAEAENMLEESHLLELEDRLLGYLYNHAGSLKIVSLLDGTAKLLTQMKNVAVTAQAAMKVSAEKLTEEVQNLQTSLATTSEEFKAVQRQAAAIEVEVVENVQERMLNLKERLFHHIDQVLDPDNVPSSPTAPGAQLSSWRRIWEKSAAFFLRTRSAEISSDHALKAKLADLHNDIKTQIESEITDFWHGLETATNQTYQDLIAVINQHLLELARKIEGSVGKVLDLCLRPLDICLQRPSAEEFHSSIEALLRSGIREGKRSLTKQRTVDHVEWQKKYRGICNQTEYYIGVPTKRNEIYKEEIPVYSLDPQSIKEYFHNMVQQSISVSIVNVKDYVHTFMSDQIAKAHAKISNYSALYSDAMSAALTAKSLTAFEQNANMAALKDNISAVDGLLKSANEIAIKATNLFPKLDLDDFDWITDSESMKDLETDYSDLAARLRDLPKLGSKANSASAGPLSDPLGVKTAPPKSQPMKPYPKPSGGSLLKDVSELARDGQLPDMSKGIPAQPAPQNVPTSIDLGLHSEPPESPFEAARQIPGPVAGAPVTFPTPVAPFSAPNVAPVPAPAQFVAPPTSFVPTMGNLVSILADSSDSEEVEEDPLLGGMDQRMVQDDSDSVSSDEVDQSSTSNDSSDSSDSESDDQYSGSDSYSEESEAYSEANSYGESEADSSSSSEDSPDSESEMSREDIDENDQLNFVASDVTPQSSMYSSKDSFASPQPAPIIKLTEEKAPSEISITEKPVVNNELLDTIPVMPIEPVDISQLPTIKADQLPVSEGMATPAVVPHQAETIPGGASLYQPSSSSEDYAEWECVSETDANSPSAQQ